MTVIPRTGRPWTVHSLSAALALLAAVMLALIALVSAGYAQAGQPWSWIVLRVIAGAVAYTAAGIVAWWRRPSNRSGLLMVLGAVIWLTSGLSAVPGPVLATVGVITRLAPFAVIVHLMLAFPSGRLRSALARTTVAAAYVVCIAMQAPAYLFSPTSGTARRLMIADRPDLATVGMWVQAGAGWATMLATATILVTRLRRAGPAQRTALGPLYIYGVLVAIAIPLLGDVIRPLTGISPEAFNAAEIALLVVAPVLLTVAMLSGGFARAGEIEELGAWLGSAGGTRQSLPSALASALGDPSVCVAYRMSDSGEHVDADGNAVLLPDADDRRGCVDVWVDGRPVGVIIYDATLIADPGIVRAAGRVIALAVDHQRLTAALAASHQQLQRSRLRIVQAGDRERRRIAQNLHDGLQAELVLLALEAQRLADGGHPAHAMAAAAARLRAGIDAAAAGLRDLVFEVMPAPLIERGFAAATEDLVDRMPVPTRLSMDIDGDLPPAVQSTAYFVVAEGLNNAIKHSGANKISVAVWRDGSELTVRIDDDGVGGARANGGFGLTGLADRVEVLGGVLTIDSVPGEGTHVVARLPVVA
jgi:signal transduction histidine kinase